MSGEPIVIVGGGHAGSELAVALRQAGSKRPITIVGEEGYPPYQRPPLSKSWLSLGGEVDALTLRPRKSYAAAGIDLVTDARVEVIEREMKEIRLSDGRTLSYANLALATGARPRRLDVPDAPSADACHNIHYLRTIDDVVPLRQQFDAGRHAVVIGGGYIGLEFAAAAVKRGLKVTLVEALPRVLTRVTAPPISAFYEDVHRDAGVDIRTGTTVEGFEFNANGDRAVAIRCRAAGGAAETIAADLVVIGIGIVPNVELAKAAGLKVDGGIIVDEFARTSDPAIVAAGDCTRHPSPYCDGLIRLESVPNAVEQARTAAATLCGFERPHHAVPWFWSDQFDLKLQTVGLSSGHDRLAIRGSIGARCFAAFYLLGEQVIAVDAINRPKDFMLAKRIVAARATARAEDLADESFDLKLLCGERAGAGTVRT